MSGRLTPDAAELVLGHLSDARKTLPLLVLVLDRGYSNDAREAANHIASALAHLDRAVGCVRNDQKRESVDGE